jgi:hypothetical protein
VIARASGGAPGGQPISRSRQALLGGQPRARGRARQHLTRRPATRTIQRVPLDGGPAEPDWLGATIDRVTDDEGAFTTRALAFLPGVAEKLGYYVYALRDPREGRGGAIFYVGKGVGDRVYHHARAALEELAPEARASLKLDTIRDIHAAGLEVGVEIVRHRMTEGVSFEVEAGLIDGLHLMGVDLTNEVVGMDSIARGWHPLQELIALYAATELEPTTDRLMLIKINRLYKPAMSGHEVYEITRKWWVCNPARHPSIALAIYQGIVRAAYHVDSWELAKPENGGPPGRWAFVGHTTDELTDRYRWKSVHHLAGSTQNPISYANCD